MLKLRCPKCGKGYRITTDQQGNSKCGYCGYKGEREEFEVKE